MTEIRVVHGGRSRRRRAPRLRAAIKATAALVGFVAFNVGFGLGVYLLLMWLAPVG